MAKETNQRKPNLSPENMLRSQPPVLVCYKDGTLIVGQLAAREEDEPWGGSTELDVAFRALTHKPARIEKRVFFVEDEYGAPVNPALVAWIDSDAVALHSLEAYPPRTPSIYEGLRGRVVKHHFRCLGMLAGRRRTPARAEASRVNGLRGGRLPSDPVKRREAIKKRELLRDEIAKKAANAAGAA